MATFSDLQLKTTADFALQSLHSKIAPVSDFTHNFRDLEGQKGASIVIANYALSAAGEFNSSTNNYFGGVNEIVGQEVSLNKHFVKSVAITDRNIADTDIQFVRDAGIGIGDTLGRAVYGAVKDVLATTTITADMPALSAVALGDYTDLFATVYDKDMDIGQTVLMLAPTYYSKLLGKLTANVWGGTDPVQSGRIPNFMGFKSVVCAPNLGDGICGYLVDANSVGLAARYLAPEEAAYAQCWEAADENGLPIGFRYQANPASGIRYLAGEVLFGCGIIRSNGVVKLV